MTLPQSKNSMDLKRKLEILEEVDMNTSSKKIKTKFSIDSKTLSRIKIQKDKIKQYSGEINQEMKRLKKGKYEEINKFVLEIINDCNECFSPVNSLFIKSAALEFAKKKI